MTPTLGLRVVIGLRHRERGTLRLLGVAQPGRLFDLAVMRSHDPVFIGTWP